MEDADVKMSEISDVSSSKHGEVSTTRIRELLNKYGSDARKSKAEDSCVSMKLPFQMTRERQQSDPVPSSSLSISLNSVCSSSSNSSVSMLPASFTPAPNVASVRTRPPLSYSARITPRPRKINSVTKVC